MTEESARNKQNRPVIIAGNWKMYKTIEEATQFMEQLSALMETSSARVYIAAPFTAIRSASEKVSKLGISVSVGAENMHDAIEGAFTGEISARMLKEAGAKFVLLGHSERRHVFHESDGFINKKVKKALEEGLEPILCIGETLEEREGQKVEETLQRQIAESLAGVSAAEMKKIVLAYEPVWAIGTGKVAKNEDAEAAQLYCRKVIAELWNDDVAASAPILYGGSAKPNNAGGLLAQPNVDGLLIGGASLSPESFNQIIQCVES